MGQAELQPLGSLELKQFQTISLPARAFGRGGRAAIKKAIKPNALLLRYDLSWSSEEDR
jgi:hypothetical protein